MPTSFATTTLAAPPPERVTPLTLPRRHAYFPSPADWRDEVLYFLLVDRFSDGNEAARPLLDRTNLVTARPAPPGHVTWRWDFWARSGSDHWQGGTIAGLRSQLDYLAGLGVTALWLSPVFRQRGHLDTFHGYGIQDFLDVDPRFGTRADLVALVDDAHARGIRIILDIIFNHSGANWQYPGGQMKAPYRSPLQPPYDFGAWIGAQGQAMPFGTAPARPDDAVWPHELQNAETYTRAGTGSLEANDVDNDQAEHKRTDFEDLRDFRLETAGVLDHLARCYAYWIALTDCDGFRIDTLKHVTFEQARNFCGAIKEYAANLGKARFLLIGEIAGGDGNARSYLDVLGRNLDAALDIGEMRLTLTGVAKGLRPPADYFAGFTAPATLGSHRMIGERHVSVLDDHDHVSGAKIRFPAEATPAQRDRQATAAVALQLFTLGLPCLYYGTEQALGGPPEASERTYLKLESWEGHDRYLRETMFGAPHPRASGLAGRGGAFATDLPGFGPLGTAGAHCFDPQFVLYRRIAALAAVRKQFPVLRVGRQYQRPLSNFGAPFALPPAGELIAWSRLLSDEEALCVVNGHGDATRGGDVLVDAALNPPGTTFTIVAHTQQTAQNSAAGVRHPIGSTLPVQRRADGTAYLEIRDIPPSEVLVLVNHA